MDHNDCPAINGGKAQFQSQGPIRTAYFLACTDNNILPKKPKTVIFRSDVFMDLLPHNYVFTTSRPNACDSHNLFSDR